MQRHCALGEQLAVLAAAACSTRSEYVPRADSTQPGGKEGREVPRAGTAVGVLRLVVSPTPSWPSALYPKHLTVASPSNAHVWAPAMHTRTRAVCVQQRGRYGAAARGIE